MVLCCQRAKLPRSKECWRGGNDGSDIAIMPYISSKAPLPFLRPCLRIDSLFSAVFTLFFIIRTLLLRAGLRGAGRFSTNSNRTFTLFPLRLSLSKCCHASQVCQEYIPFPGVKILPAPAETFAYLLNMADPHAGWHTSAMDPHTARWYRSLIGSVRGYT